MEPFIGQIIVVAFNFAPQGWALCDGKELSINDNKALYSLLGTTFGGDGKTTFRLPDLCGRVPIHTGLGAGLTKRNLGEKGGFEEITLLQNQIPPHNHTAMFNASDLTMKTTGKVKGINILGNTGNPANALPANTGPLTTDPEYHNNPSLSSLVDMNSNMLSLNTVADAKIINVTVNANQPSSSSHPNLQPFLVLNYIIALEGIYPTKS